MRTHPSFLYFSKIIGRVRIGGTDGCYLCGKLSFKPYRMKKLIYATAVFAAVVTLSACSGSDSDDEPSLSNQFMYYWCPLNRYNDLWNPFGLKESRSKHYATSPSFNFVNFQEGLPKPSPMLPPNPFPGVPRIHERQYST